jgi:hypothetical protein
MSIAEQSGGNVSLTAVIVLFCGIFGSIVGPPILRVLGIKSSVAKGREPHTHKKITLYIKKTYRKMYASSDVSRIFVSTINLHH